MTQTNQDAFDERLRELAMLNDLIVKNKEARQQLLREYYIKKHQSQYFMDKVLTGQGQDNV